MTEHYSLTGDVNGRRYQTIVVARTADEAVDLLNEHYVDEWTNVEVEN